MEHITQLLDLILHIDKHIDVLFQQYGTWAYGILNAIIFSETGLVIFPFLPGDTLLFIAGAFSAKNTEFSTLFLISTLIISAIAGNTVNYLIGRYLGKRFEVREFRWIDKNALDKTHAFYEKYGGITIVLARFVPVVRTFAPFVAGLSEMTFAKFQIFNIVGAALWIVGLVFAGYFFGHISFIRDNLSIIVLVGVGAAAIPVALAAFWKILQLMKKKTS